MNSALVVTWLVTWKIVGYSMAPCSDPKQQDQISNMCIQSMEYVRSAKFDKKLDATNFAWDVLKTAQRPYKIEDVHVYEEQVFK